MPKVAPKFDAAVEALMADAHSSIQENPLHKRLWLADEHPLNPTMLKQLDEKLLFVTNRFDQHCLAEQQGLRTFFNDFDPENLGHQNQVYIRIPKERAQVHHLLNSAHQALAPNGQLFLYGYKGEGIKSHLEKVEKLFGNKAIVRKGKNQLWVCQIQKGEKIGDPIDDQDYRVLRQLSIDSMSFWSKPGIYGWDKIDRGSKLLADCLISHHEQQSHGQLLTDSKVLDLGCGYGYLSLRVSELQPSQITATDNCAAALVAAKKNLGEVNANIFASDGGSSIQGKFDLILCNPPFHQGFSTNPDLHSRFLKNSKRLLTESGEAWYVVNQFVPLEKIAKETRLDCLEVKREDGFKILKLAKKIDDLSKAQQFS